MSLSVVYICNLALTRLGEKPILSLDDDFNEAAKACKLHWDNARDSVLRRSRWNFATERATLTADAVAPAFGWSIAYTLPEDCLRVLQLNRWEDWQEPKTWEIEGRRLVTDQDAAQIKYTRRVEDPNLFDALFVDAVSVYLAARVAKMVTGSETLGAQMIQIFDNMIGPEARRLDAQESRSKQREKPWVTSDLVKSRGAVGWGQIVDWS